MEKLCPKEQLSWWRLQQLQPPCVSPHHCRSCSKVRIIFEVFSRDFSDFTPARLCEQPPVLVQCLYLLTVVYSFCRRSFLQNCSLWFSGTTPGAELLPAGNIAALWRSTCSLKHGHFSILNLHCSSSLFVPGGFVPEPGRWVCSWVGNHCWKHIWDQ